MIIREICSRDPVVIAGSTDLVVVAELMRVRHVGFLVVTEDGTPASVPIGVLTDRDIVIEVIAKSVDASSLTARDVMSAGPLTIAAEDSPEHALRQMRSFGVRRAPVVDGHGRLVGVIALDDLLDWLSNTLADAAAVVRRGPHIERRLRT